MDKIHNTTIDLDWDYFEDLKHNMGITLRKTAGCEPDKVKPCVNKLLDDLKVCGITINCINE